MKKILLYLSLFLAACSSPDTSMDSIDHTGHHMPASAASQPGIVVLDQSDGQSLAFILERSGIPLKDYGISHTKEMHVIAVRNDLRHFYHLHPERDADGLWKVPFTPETGGTYWIYADFVEASGLQHVIKFEREYPGEKGEYGVAKDMARTRTVDGYTFTLAASELGDGGIQLNYQATDEQGRPVVFQKYLGEKGHVVLLSESGEYIHTHPLKEYVRYKESDVPVFVTPTLWDRYYRIYAQFQIDEKVVTVPFDWEREGVGLDPSRRMSSH